MTKNHFETLSEEALRRFVEILYGIVLGTGIMRVDKILGGWAFSLSNMTGYWHRIFMLIFVYTVVIWDWYTYELTLKTFGYEYEKIKHSTSFRMDIRFPVDILILISLGYLVGNTTSNRLDKNLERNILASFFFMHCIYSFLVSISLARSLSLVCGKKGKALFQMAFYSLIPINCLISFISTFLTNYVNWPLSLIVILIYIPNLVILFISAKRVRTRVKNFM